MSLLKKKSVFKTCPSCAQTWSTREFFLSDAKIELNGYQAFKRREKGLFLFTHTADNCYSTMGIDVIEFNDMFTGVRFSENKALSDDCPRYCENVKRLDRCSEMCEYAYVREILHKINIRGNPLPHRSKISA